MSIPPLVCSTPPPPDQCEDEKVPGIFDFQYNLSPEDEHNEYDYEEFATYSEFQFQSTGTKTNDTNLENNEDNTNETAENHISPTNGTPDKKENVLQENSISVSQTPLQVHQTATTNTEFDEQETLNCVQEPEPSLVQSNGVNSNQQIDDDLSKQPENTDFGTLDLKTHTLDEIEIQQNDMNTQTLAVQEISEGLIETFKDELVTQVVNTNTTIPDNTNNSPTKFQNEDDFGDFEDFQFDSTSSNITKTIIAECSNPWDQNEPTNISFGDFEANFDDPPSTTQNDMIPTPHVQVNKSNKDDDDDDFGDFDEFKSSSIDKSEIIIEKIPYQQLHYLNLPESQMMDNINKIISSIFHEEIPEPVKCIEGNLESLLCETWGHLMDVDERQPYIVPWNNCLGQKTLLKALCIDSRNILFGPKWNYNMPKYAANLSNAPLQPQKPVSNAIANSVESTVTDKSNSSWTDPFKSDGQESCSSDSESRPSGLGAFDATCHSKPDKVYSSTLAVQPIRQINLPDTHIFTPSNSETPRSKTIHYNTIPPELSPEVVTKESEKSNTLQLNITEQDEYSDFQDFTNSSSTTNIKSNITTIQQPNDNQNHNVISENAMNSVCILQPIKLKPIIPTLNWPDPGEVKETFDDFADFVSSTSAQQAPISAEKRTDRDNLCLAEKSKNNISDSICSIQKSSPKSSSLDDDFDTFQSAVPSVAKIEDINSTKITSESILPHLPTDQISDIDMRFNNKFIQRTPLQEAGSQMIPLKPNSLTNDKDISKKDSHTTASPMLFSDQHQFNLASYMQNQPNSGQILQPLSLESYSQINWPNPGIDLQDLSRFNPVETLNSLKHDIVVSGNSKTGSPVHTQKSSSENQPEDDVWGEFMSSKPKHQQVVAKKASVFGDDDEWTDFVSSPTVKPQNGLNTISLNVHTNLNMQKKPKSLDIPALNYITPKSSNHKTLNDRHFQNL